MSKNNKSAPGTPSEGIKKKRDEKTKKNFNSFAWYLAWIGFTGVVLSSLFKLIKNMEQPKKDDYYK